MSNYATNQDFFDYLKSKKENKTEKPVKTQNFDLKNYLNIKLGKDESMKKIVIRLLPISKDNMTNFVEVYTHMVKIDGKWKSFICLEKTEQIDHEKLGNKCPFCELNQQFWVEWRNADNETKKKVYQTKANEYQANQSIICRLIERGKEEDGPKFWKFNVSKKGDGPMDAIQDLAMSRAENGIDIFDLENGYDLEITVKKQKKSNGDEQTIISSIFDKVKRPLSENKEIFDSWVNDEKEWNDVFTAKPYEYMDLMLNNKTPWFDKQTQKWIEKPSNQIIPTNTGQSTNKEDDVPF